MASNQKVIKQLSAIIALTLAWRGALFLLSKTAQSILPYDPSFPYHDIIFSLSNIPQWIYSWANFDGVHYITLARNGYVGTGLIQAFFPLYPAAIALLIPLQISSIISGLTLSFLGLVGAACTLFLLVKKHFTSRIAFWSVIGLLLFPTSFFFAALYSESFFLFFILQALYWYERKKWLLLTIFIGSASATRLVGIALVPVLLLDIGLQDMSFKARTVSTSRYLWQGMVRIIDNWTQNVRAVISVSLGSVGLLGYMTYLYYTFGDALYFYHVQPEFGGGREEQIVLLPQVIFRTLKIVLTVPVSILRTPVYIQELLAGTLPLILLALLYKKVPTTWLVFSAIALLLPTATGTFSSMPRYALVAFPLFVGFGLLMRDRPKVGLPLLLLSTFLMVFNTILFIQGYWVA